MKKINISTIDEILLKCKDIEYDKSENIKLSENYIEPKPYSDSKLKIKIEQYHDHDNNFLILLNKMHIKDNYDEYFKNHPILEEVDSKDFSDNYKDKIIKNQLMGKYIFMRNKTYNDYWISKLLHEYCGSKCYKVGIFIDDDDNYCIFYDSYKRIFIDELKALKKLFNILKIDSNNGISIEIYYMDIVCDSGLFTRYKEIGICVRIPPIIESNCKSASKNIQNTNI